MRNLVLAFLIALGCGALVGLGLHHLIDEFELSEGRAVRIVLGCFTAVFIIVYYLKRRHEEMDE